MDICKRALPLLCVLVLLFALPCYGANVFTGDPNCVSLWQFESSVADTVDGNELTDGPAPSYNADCKEGTLSIDFEHNGSEYRGRSNPALSLGFPGTSGEQSFSITCWFKVEAFEDDAAGLVAKTNSYELQIDASTQRLRFQVYYSGGSTTLEAGRPCSTGVWYHVAAAYDASNNKVKLRIWDDGAGNFLQPGNSTTFCGGDMVSSAGDFYIGRGSTGYFDGLIDEAVVFDDVLTNSEIDKIRAGVYDTTTGPVYVPDDYAEIQTAIENVPNGSTIIVRNSLVGSPYRYIELGLDLQPNTQKHYLTIMAENPGGATIDASGIVGAAVFVQNVTGTTIHGFNLQKAGSVGEGSGVFFFNADRTTRRTVTVQNCNMGGGSAFRAGVRLLGYVEATITGNTIVGAQNAGIANSVDLGDPLPNEDFLYADSVVIIEGNEIDGSSIAENAGIILKGDDRGGSCDCVVDPACEVTTCCDTEVAAGTCPNTAHVFIGGSGTAQNRIHGHGTAGIRLEDIYGPVVIDNNLVYGNDQPGIITVDVGSATEVAAIQNNDVYSNNQAGISVAGATYLNIADNTIRNNGQSGVGFNRTDIQVIYGKPVGASSQPVMITRNDIYGNGQGGVGVLDRITGAVTISRNNIHANLGGVGIQNGCTLEVSRNSIYNNLRGGVHTGTNLIAGGGFSGALGSAQLTIRQNRIYRNGLSEFGAGIDVRHASGVIHNNIVYRNYMGGIRFGDYITEIKNNTVVNNGQGDVGGGISYDDVEGAVNDPPSGTLKDSPNLPDPVIRNNISAFNVNAGLRVGVGSLATEDEETGSAQGALTGDGDSSGQSCFVATAMAADEPVLEPSEDCPTNQSLGGGYYWDYNLLYCNNETCDGSAGERGYPDNCGWPPPYELGEEICVTMNYAACPPLGLANHHHVIADPMFVDMDADDYRLQAGSPAKGAGDDGTDMGAYGGSTPIDW